MRLEGIEMLLDFINNGLILQDRTVVCKVDFGGLLGELGYSTTGILVALLEGLEGRDSLAAKTEGGGDFGPVELQRCTSLERNRLAVIEPEGDESSGTAQRGMPG